MIKAHNIDLIVYDFDGVMTNNHAMVFEDGTEAVIISRADGLGVDLIRKHNVPQMIISTESNPVVSRRANKLKIDVLQDCKDKKDALIYICEKKQYDISKVIFIGNDLNDLDVMKTVGYPIAPSDAHPLVIDISILVTKAKGGDGVIRELADILSGDNV
tara:strand:- start:6419 stop:6895 length:477 start_codon:yes stop_codon:yes gene_type:complete